MLPRRPLLIMLIVCCLLIAGTVIPTQAQEQAILSLEMDSTELQTGQSYTVSIRLEGVTNLWAVYVQIAYDPSLVYVIGTKSGSPVTPGALFSSDTSLIVFNGVQDNLVTFAPSRVRPADPIEGGGVIGTFRIYPLQAGKTPMLFSKAEIVRRDTSLIPFTPVLVDLTITGDTVEPPDEATATPAPTITPSPEAQVTVDMEPTVVPTLVNVTAAPATMAPTPMPVAAAESDNSALTIALIILGISGLGIIILLLIWLRSRRR